MKTKKAMKKITHIGMAALVAMGMLGTSCNKAESPEIETPETQKENIVTLTTTVGFAADGTKALTGAGVKTFAEGETMAIYYWKNEGNDHEKAVSAPLTAGDITNGGKSATFTFTLDNPYKEQSVVYTYPAAMAKADFTPNYDALYNNQDGTLATLASNFDFCTKSGAWNGDNLPTLTLENQLAILAITLMNADGSSNITSSITGLTLSEGTKTYNVNRSAVAGPIYVAICPTADATITVTATDGTKNYSKTLTSKTYTASNGYPVSWRMTESASDVLAGKFSVSGSKTVKFSKGNLRYASGVWSFFDNQYDYYNSYSADAWDKFGWSTSAPTYGMNTSTDEDPYFGDFVDWGATMGTGWFTLSKDEWTYLFNTRSASTVGGTSNGRYAMAKVNDVQGIILFPDTYTHPDGVTAPTNVNTASASFDSNTYTVADWTKMESAGCVFLPAAGSRSGSSVNVPGTYGGYWSAAPASATNAYYVYFQSSNLVPEGYNGRRNGLSVRLVRQVTE